MADPIRLAFVGDVMCGDRLSHLGWGVASMLERYGPAYLPQDVRGLLRGHDLALCNVECVLSDVGRRDWSLRRLHMRGRPIASQYLADWGFTVADVANNHILEQGIEAAGDTVVQLRNAGIQVIGSGHGGRFEPSLEPLRLQLGREAFSLIGLCFHPGRYAFNGGFPDLAWLTALIREEARAHRHVIVSVHWGQELIDYPGLQQRRLAEQFVGAGARLIIGHHPHVFQGIVAMDESLVAYSLGDFLFDTSSQLTSWSAILSVTWEDGAIREWRTHPFVQGRDYRPELAQGDERRRLGVEIERRCRLACEPIKDESRYEEQYVGEANRLEEADRREYWRGLLGDWRRHRPIFWPQILWCPVRRRLGIW